MAHLCEVLDPGHVRQLLIDQDLGFEHACESLKLLYPNDNISVRSLKRFSAMQGIKKRGSTSNPDLVTAVTTAVSEVGPVFGRKMMKGYLESRYGMKVSKQRIATTLSRVQPDYHARRQTLTHGQLNPQRYHAPYFLYNVHMDQNEKVLMGVLVMYGVVFALAIDGYSNFVLSHETMAVKNNLRIYQSVYKPIIDNYGIPETIIVDRGREFYLSLFMQQHCAEHRRTQRMPFKQVRSVKNNKVERYWVEQNNRVGYPIKRAMINLENEGHIDADNEYDLFSISEVCQAVAKYGSDLAANAWNYHIVPGKGRPVDLIDVGHVTTVDPNWMLDIDSAVELYESSGGLNGNAGHLQDISETGRDLLARNVDLKVLRSQQFWNDYMTNQQGSRVGEIFGATVNGNYLPLQNAVITHINMTADIARQRLN